MIRIVRRVGIAFGSLVIAYLAVTLIAGIVLGTSAQGNPLVGVVIIVLGGLVYLDIVRRVTQRSSADNAPTA